MSAKESKKAVKSKGGKKKEVMETVQTPVQPQPEKKKSSKASKNLEEKKALDDEEGWIDVKNTRPNMKRLKAVLRKAKKVVLKEQSELKSDVIPEISSPQFSTTPASPALKSKGEKQPKKKKTKSSKPTTRVIGNEKDLVEEIIKVLNNVPNSSRLTVSAVGDRLQDVTGHSWNKKFKKTYGNLKAFLESHKEFFVDAKEQVFIKSEHDALLRSMDLKAKAKPKKPAPLVKQAKVRIADPNNSEVVSRKKGEVDEEGSSCARIFFVAALVVVVLLFILISLDAGSSQLFDSIKKRL